MAPSTLMALNQSAGSSPPPEISDAVKYALAAVMGAALGIILGAPQWRVLRRYTSGASLWVCANAVAWTVGMPVVFIGAGASPIGASALSIALTVVVTIAAAGASVGAIHGVVLLWLLRQRQEEASPAIENALSTSYRPRQRVQ
jgi:predicted anti-sigma-YlaC factor YlaD